MACTIVSTPATGATDWTTWITQQGLTDRGFSRVSLTNFATTAASAIGTGSVFELAGSIYNCTETALSLATGTASASVAVYILAIPAAGGTTCTFELDSVAPTWVDAKQGFYASAASTTRALGGMYIGTAATYFRKFIYTQEMLTGYLLPEGATRPIIKAVFDIGEWDMDATETITLDIGIERLDVRSIQVVIRNDAGPFTYELGGTPNNQISGYWTMGATASTILWLKRTSSGFFDTVSFDGTAGTVANRGWVYVEFEA